MKYENGEKQRNSHHRQKDDFGLLIEKECVAENRFIKQGVD